MKAGKASKTARYMALFRALESTRSANDRLFTDPYAINFLSRKLKITTRGARIPFVRNWLSRVIHKKIPGGFSSGVARTKYIDDILQRSVEAGVQQVMILGAGFDTRALRLDFLKALPVIEIDHPDTSNYKIDVLKKMGALPANVTYCQVDFNQQDLDSLAKQHNFDFTKPATVIWEGVTNYLSADAISKTFSFVSRFPQGSYVIFTYVHKDVLDYPGRFLGGEKLLNDLKAIEERWTFGFLPQELAAYLAPFNLKLIEDSGAAEYRNKYMPERSEEGYEFYRVATALRI